MIKKVKQIYLQVNAYIFVVKFVYIIWWSDDEKKNSGSKKVKTHTFLEWNLAKSLMNTCWMRLTSDVHSIGVAPS